jgi:hypothetical protein
MTGERRTALEIAGVQQRLVISSQLERLAAFLQGGFRFRFGVQRGIPGLKRDDSRSTQPLHL